MARIKLGSGIESTVVNDVTPEQKAEVAYQETIKMLELNKRIEELGASIKFLESRKPETIVKEHYYPVVDTKDGVDESKFINIKDDFNIINDRLDDILENQQIDELKLKQTNEILEHRLQHLTSEIKNNKNVIQSNYIAIDAMDKSYSNTMQKFNIELTDIKVNLVDFYNSTAKINKKLEKQLKTQKIINILLAVGFIISLFR